MNGAVIIEGHVQGLSNTRSLGIQGIPIIVIDKNNCIARYSKFCRKFYYCPDYLSEAFIDFLMDLGEKEKLQGWALIPSNDHVVISISRNRERLISVFKVITPESSVIENIYDKIRLLEVARSCNVPIPLSFQITSGNIPEQMPYPVLTKGRQGLSFYKATGRKVFLSNNQDELKEQLKKIEKVYDTEEIFIQEFIPFDGTNKTISFTAFCKEGEVYTHWIGQKIREHPILFGTATFARSIECNELYIISKRLLKELKYTGVCEIEYLLDPRDNQYKLIEINARTWLWVGLAKACGVDYALMSYNYLNGINEVYPVQYKIGINWVNYLTDIPYAIIAIVEGKLKVKEYVRSFQGKTQNAFFSWSDILPGIMFFILSIYIIFKRK